MSKRGVTEVSRAWVSEVESRVAKGERVGQVVDDMGKSLSQFYKIRKALKTERGGSQPKRAYTKRPRVLDITPAVAVPRGLVMFVGSAQELAQVARSLQ